MSSFFKKTLVAVTLVALVFIVPLSASAGTAEPSFWSNPIGAIVSGIVNSVGKVYAIVTETILIPIAGFILSAVGLVLDVIVKLNFNRDIFVIDGITIGWTVIRDLINMGFIFILLYSAISTILQLGGSQARQVLPRIIFAALMINFSLFFSKVIIDAGNIIAHGFYNSQVLTQNGGRSLSATFRDSLKMGVMYDAQQANGKLAPRSAGGVLDGTSAYINATMRLLLILIAIYAFGSVLFIFLGRIVGLIFMMMLAPVGFIGSILPKTSGLSSWWWKTLIDQTLVAPVFFVLMYLTVRISSSIIAAIPANTVNGSLDPTFYVNYLIVAGLLIYTVRITKKLGGEFGSIATNLGKSAAGLVGTVALGVATGGGSAALRLGARAAASSGLAGAVGGQMRSIAGGEGMGKIGVGRFKPVQQLAKRTINTTDRMSKAGFDIRENKGFQKIAGIAGLGKKNDWASSIGVDKMVTRPFSEVQKDREKIEKDYLRVSTGKDKEMGKQLEGARDEQKNLETVRNMLIAEKATLNNAPLEAEKQSILAEKARLEEEKRAATAEQNEARRLRLSHEEASSDAGVSLEERQRASREAMAAEDREKDAEKKVADIDTRIKDFDEALKSVTSQVTHNVEEATQTIDKNFFGSVREKRDVYVQQKRLAESDKAQAERELKNNEESLKTNKQMAETQLNEADRQAAQARVQQDTANIAASKTKLAEANKRIEEVGKNLEPLESAVKIAERAAEKSASGAENFQELFASLEKQTGGISGALESSAKFREVAAKEFETASKKGLLGNIFEDTETNKKIAESYKKYVKEGKIEEDDETDKDLTKLIKTLHKKRYGKDFDEPKGEEEGGDKKKKEKKEE